MSVVTPAPRPNCRSDDQEPVLCQDRRTYACLCDGIEECPDGEDESHAECSGRAKWLQKCASFSCL